MSKQRVIFCDFDGTITVNDNIVAIMKHFQPEGWEELVKGVLSKEISIREGVGRMFALLPTAQHQEIRDYAIGNVKIREGFRELLDYCREEEILFLVTSGGIDFFVYPVLSDFPIEQGRIFCNGSDFSGSHIRILWPHPCDADCSGGDCGMCKTTIMRSYPEDRYQRILIGDSITDLEGAKIADVVFARAQLIELCGEAGRDCVPFENFHEVIEGLKELKVR